MSLGQESVNANTHQSSKDIAILAEHLDTAKQAQWTGAWADLIARGFAPQAG